MRRTNRAPGRRASQASRTKRKSAKKKYGASNNLRQTLYGLGLWGLGIVNALLIFSFIHKHISKGDQKILPLTQIEQSSEPGTERIQKPRTPLLKLEVLNGCGEQGIARRFADFLEKSGFDAIKVDNFDNFSMPKTIVLDRKSKNKHNGLRVAEVLGLSSSAVRYLASQDTQADVTVIIGKDYPKIEFLRSQK